MIRCVLPVLFTAAILWAQTAPPVATRTNLQEIVLNNGAEPRSLDPAFMYGRSEQRICLALFEGLVVPNPSTGQAEPGLARSWTASADLKTYTFKLRGALWSDGTPITAQDVVDSWLRAIAPETKGALAHDLIASVAGADDYHAGKGSRERVGLRAPDPGTFEVTFLEPMPQAVNMLTEPCFDVVPVRLITQRGTDWTKPGQFVGNGPFLLKEWEPQSRIVVVKNPTYWDAANVRLERITFRPFRDQGLAYEEFKAGAIDWCPGIDPNRFHEIQARPDFHQTIGGNVTYLIFNLNRKPFTDARVRKALSMAVHRQELCETAFGLGQIPTNGFTPPMGSFTTAQGNGYNPEAARKLLADAGYPMGAGFPKVRLTYDTSRLNERVAESIQATWKAVLGVDIKLVNFDRDYVLHARAHQEFDLCRAGWLANRFPDPIRFLALFQSGHESNSGCYSSAAFDALFEQARHLPAGEARDKVLMRAEEIAVTQDQAVIPVSFYPNQDLIDLEAWGGWYPNTMGIHPWKGVYRKPDAKGASLPATASAAGDCFIRDMPSYYQLDPRIQSGAIGLCCPTSTADVIDYFAKRYPRLKPGTTTGFDLIRMFAHAEGTGLAVGTSAFEVETRIKQYIEKAGYSASVQETGIGLHGSSPRFTPYDLGQVKAALLDPDTAVMVELGYYDYDQATGNYVQGEGHMTALMGYTQDSLILADPARMVHQSQYRLDRPAHPEANLVAANKKYVLCRQVEDLMELDRHDTHHDFIEAIIFIHISNK